MQFYLMLQSARQNAFFPLRTQLISLTTPAKADGGPQEKGQKAFAGRLHAYSCCVYSTLSKDSIIAVIGGMFESFPRGTGTKCSFHVHVDYRQAVDVACVDPTETKNIREYD